MLLPILSGQAGEGYDLGKLGTWQHLVAFAETTPNRTGGHLSIEKGAREVHFDTSLGLDDVSLALRESP